MSVEIPALAAATGLVLYPARPVDDCEHQLKAFRAQPLGAESDGTDPWVARAARLENVK